MPCKQQEEDDGKDQLGVLGPVEHRVAGVGGAMHHGTAVAGYGAAYEVAILGSNGRTGVEAESWR